MVDLEAELDELRPRRRLGRHELECAEHEVHQVGDDR